MKRFLWSTDKRQEAKESKQRKTAGRKRRPPRVPETNQQVMEMMISEWKDDLFRIGKDMWSMAFEYDDINFKTANAEDGQAIFLKYVDLLNSFTESTHIQLSTVITPINTERFKKDYRFDEDHLPEGPQRLLAREFNDLIDYSIGLKENTLVRRRYVTLSQEAESYEEAQIIFRNLAQKMEEKFKDLGTSIRTVSAQERFEVLHDLFNVQTLESKGITDIQTAAHTNGQTVYDLLAPREMLDLRHDDYIELRDEEGKSSRFIRSMYVDPDLPKAISAKFFNSLTTIEDIHMITTINITPCETTKILKKLMKKKSGLETERFDKMKSLARQGIEYRQIQDERLESAIDDIEQLMDDIKELDQKIFQENILVTLVADEYKELEEQTSKVINAAGEQLVKIRPLKWQQLEGIQNTLPLGHNTFQIQHTETSEATAVHVPFSAKDFLHEKSIFYGTNMVSRNPIFLDRSRLINGNGCILATSGAGKSFQVKTMAEEILLRYPQDNVIFVDFQKEYGLLVKEFGGQTITIANSTDSHINPLDLSADYSLSEDGGDTPIKAKTEYMQGWVESIIDEGPLGPVEKTLIDRCVRNIFFDYEASDFKDRSLQPGLHQFQTELENQEEPEAHRLSKSLERFVSGSLDLFAHETNVDIRNRVVNFDVSGLPSSIQTAGYLVILDHIMNRLIENRRKGIATHVFVDEFHILLANPSGADYVAKLVKIGRKYNAFITVITQNISDVYDKEAGRKILGNAEFAMILRQKATDREMIQQIYDISDSEARFFSGDARQGQGIIVYGSDKIPFSNPVPRNTRIYQLNNTDRLQTSR
ncbi:VirB4-like conjugal transfer ATPase, CD1110 family [Faecalibaculum rodentium]|jgi:type IV secretory pathway VirB4 component|uniref:VirB4-like conjugal transfer ATPase, CD1110 family n=3 Tax=Faecalibaculum rodentium TaxID=1702221 RepID=UPI00248FC9BC|nr:ATP-binding protein [Faecalibaculum rodentium]